VLKINLKLRKKEKNFLLQIIKGYNMNSLTHRMDNRSKEIFSENIKDFTGREQDWIRIYAADLSSRGESVEICNYGVDNTGGLIAGNLCNNNADNLIIINGKTYKVDIKTIPEWSTTFTFKTFLLQDYINQGACILVPRMNLYYVMSPTSMRDMLKSFEHMIYRSFSPNDKAIRFGQAEMDQYVFKGHVRTRSWTPEACALIKQHRNSLFKKKNIG